MTDVSSESANRNAHEAAGPPPGQHALMHSGLVDQPKSSVRIAIDRFVGFLAGRSAEGKQS